MIALTNKSTSFKQHCDIWAMEKHIEHYHSTINHKFSDIVNSDAQLKSYRDYVEQNIMGFGERSFLWLWKLLVDEMPEHFRFMEIGVFKGQILGLITLLAGRVNKWAIRYGVTPLSSIGVNWESDYEWDIKRMHEQFNLNPDYTLIKYDSTTEAAINEAYDHCSDAENGELDMLYVDGGHDYNTALSDLQNYSRLVKHGGYVIVDDACCDMPIPFGMFPGIQEVTKACNDYFNGKKDEYKLVFSIVHIKVYKKH